MLVVLLTADVCVVVRKTRGKSKSDAYLKLSSALDFLVRSCARIPRILRTCGDILWIDLHTLKEI
jgi:hypothetical protein